VPESSGRLLRVGIPTAVIAVLCLALPALAPAAKKPKEPPACTLMSAAQARSVLATIDKFGDAAKCTKQSSKYQAVWGLAVTSEQEAEYPNAIGSLELNYYVTAPKNYLAKQGVGGWGNEHCFAATSESGSPKKVAGVGSIAYYCNGSMEAQKGEADILLLNSGIEPAPTESSEATVMKAMLKKLG